MDLYTMNDICFKLNITNFIIVCLKKLAKF